MKKFLGKYRISSIRLSGWDYGSPGIYFVTICTRQRINYFGDIISNPVEPHNYVAPRGNKTESKSNTKNVIEYNQIGKIAQKYWIEIPKHFPFVELDEFIIMPNHIHGILSINRNEYTDWNQNKFGPQSNNLPSLIRGYKASVKRFANINSIEFFWQSRYYEHIIDNFDELERIRYYIKNNIRNWYGDEYY